MDICLSDLLLHKKTVINVMNSTTSRLNANSKKLFWVSTQVAVRANKIETLKFR